MIGSALEEGELLKHIKWKHPEAPAEDSSGSVCLSSGVIRCTNELATGFDKDYILY